MWRTFWRLCQWQRKTRNTFTSFTSTRHLTLSELHKLFSSTIPAQQFSLLRSFVFVIIQLFPKKLGEYLSGFVIWQIESSHCWGSLQSALTLRMALYFCWMRFLFSLYRDSVSPLIRPRQLFFFFKCQAHEYKNSFNGVKSVDRIDNIMRALKLG